MEYNKYVSKREALKQLGISSMTLLKMAENNTIEYMKTDGGHRKYNINKYIKENKIKTEKEQLKEIIESNNNTDKIDICYIRVSTLGQKDDLERQKLFMTNKYPNYELIEDIGSGINFNRKGLRKIINLAISYIYF